MSTGNASSPLVTPSTVTSIHSLPFEIKALIVKLAKIQDYNFSERASADPSEDQLCSGILKDNHWRGKSLNALFLVNKEWSDLAAVHLFKSMIVAPRICSIYFKCCIFPRRAHLFEELRFVHGGQHIQISQAALVALPFLPNVKTLFINSVALQQLFGHSEFGSSGNEDFDSSFQCFRTFGKQVTKLETISLTRSSIGIFSALSKLKHLEIGSISIELDVAEQNSIGNALAALPLESLSLGFGVRDQTLKYFSEVSWTASSTLRSLKITCFRFGADHIEFIQNFSNSLERLELSPRSVQEDISSFKFTSPLLKLQRLSIITDSTCFTALLPLFSTSPIITLYLEECNVKADNSVASLILSPLILFINKSPLLRQIEINDRYAPGSRYTTLSQLCKSKNVVLNFTTWDQQYLLDEDDDPSLSNGNFVTSAIPHLKEALDFGNRRLVELEKDEDVEGMKEMFENCRWLRAHAALEKD